MAPPLSPCRAETGETEVDGFDSLNNALDNLQVMTRAEHVRLHRNLEYAGLDFRKHLGEARILGRGWVLRSVWLAAYCCFGRLSKTVLARSASLSKTQISG